MTYNVFGGTLSLTQSINPALYDISCRKATHPSLSPEMCELSLVTKQNKLLPTFLYCMTS